MPAGYGAGNHHMFVIDFQEASIVGKEPPHIQHFSVRRLNTQASSGATKKYVEHLEANIARHRLIEKLRDLLQHHPQHENPFSGNLTNLTGKARISCLMRKKGADG